MTNPLAPDEMRDVLAAVRACRLPPAKGMSVHGPYEVGASWNISGLTKLLPRIDAALNTHAMSGESDG